MQKTYCTTTGRGPIEIALRPRPARPLLSNHDLHGSIVPMTALPSPCTKDCKITPATGLCRGCLRTIQEIISWGGADETEQARVLAAIEQRRVGRGEPKKVP